MKYSKREFIKDWIGKNFADVKIIWAGESAIIEDKKGEKMTVEFKGCTLYADGKPYNSIPSLADVE